MYPVQKIEFLGLTLGQEKISKIISLCQDMPSSQNTTLMDLTHLIRKLGSTAQAVLPARLQVRHLQRQQSKVFRETKSYQTKIVLDKTSQA